MGIKIILIIAILFTLISCGGMYNGHMETSNKMTESKANNHYRATYVPNKFDIIIANSLVGKLDTAFAEVTWGLDDNAKTFEGNEQAGYNFIFATKQFNFDKYYVSIADTNNQNGHWGCGIDGTAFGIKKLQDTINVLITDNNPYPDSTNYNWKPTILDTIKFVKQK
jgi:hypothetical protein